MGYTVLHSFDGNSGDGWVPQGGLTQGPDGAFYGTTVYGGDLAGGNGTITYGGDSAGGMVFRLGPSPLLITAFHRLPDKTMVLSLSGAANTTCRIDACANLGSWVTLTNLPNATGTIHFIDTSAPRYPRRFYRAVQAP